MKKTAFVILGVVLVLFGGYVLYTNLPADEPTLTEPVTNGMEDQDTDTQNVPTNNSGIETSFTLATIAEHKDSTSCWSAIGGNVYDLTAWIDMHPGGASNILKLCGIDGTSVFLGQHGGQPQPEAVLTDYQIGTLAN